MVTRPLAEVRALSLWRPWPWLVLHARKDVENRTWPTRYRGPLILAGTAIVLEFTAGRRYLLTITHQPAAAGDGASADALAGWIERHITAYLTRTTLDPANWHVAVTPTGGPAPASVRSAA